MTKQEAYIAGFCKKAESLGYDPNSLASYALQSRNLTKNAAWNSWLGKGIGRYFELLLGGAGRGKALGRISKVQKHVDILNRNYARAKAAYKNQLAQMRANLKQQEAAYRAAGDPRADWTHIQNLRNQIFDFRRRGGTDEMFKIQKKINAKKRLIDKMYDPIASESRKVFATRWGTGLAGLGGVGLYMNSNNQEKQNFGTDDRYMDD